MMGSDELSHSRLAHLPRRAASTMKRKVYRLATPRRENKGREVERERMNRKEDGGLMNDSLIARTKFTRDQRLERNALTVTRYVLA